jgi:hypothetical protein
MKVCAQAIGAVRPSGYPWFDLGHQETYDSSLDTLGIPILLRNASICWQLARR